jgi:HTH-type transcriptional regulator/antitoxin HigA
MAVETLNEAAYKKLLTRVMPKVIETEEENERVVAELERLDTLGRAPTAEEQQMAELLTVLVQQFEARAYPLGRSSPVEALKVLMENHGLRQRDLISIFGSSSVASDVVNGKRGISKAHARKLADRFGVPADLFL